MNVQSRFFVMRAALGCALALAVLLSGPAAAARRGVALVIGNSAYPDAALRQPANDAREIRDALRAKGFDVILERDLKRADLLKAVRDFGQIVDRDDTALFYFSGFAVQSNGENYLLPVDAEVQAENDLAAQALGMRDVLQALAAVGNARSFVVLEANRASPYEARLRAQPAGLAAVQAPPRMTVGLAPSTDATPSQNTAAVGAYTAQLVKALRDNDIGAALDIATAATRAGAAAEPPPTSSRRFLREVYQSIAALRLTELPPLPLPAPPVEPKTTPRPESKPEPRPKPPPPVPKIEPRVESPTAPKVEPPPARIPLTIRATPRDAEVRIVNIGQRYRPGIRLAPGTYDIEARREGYQPRRERIALSTARDTFAIVLEKLVEAPRIDAFDARPDTARPGQRVELCYRIRNAEQAEINGFGAVRPDRDCVVLIAQRDSLYTLSARGAGGVDRASVRVKVDEPPPVAPVQIEYFDAKPRVTTPGGRVQLCYRIRNAEQAEIRGLGPVRPDQDCVAVAVKTDSVFLLAARGAGGDDRASVRVAVRRGGNERDPIGELAPKLLLERLLRQPTPDKEPGQSAPNRTPFKPQ